MKMTGLNKTNTNPQKKKLNMDNLLKGILNIQSESYNQVDMQNYILANYPTADMDKHGNIYITKGKADSYPCVVAHLDTVHDIIPDDHYHVLQTDRKVFAWDSNLMQPTGVGGDDKCGIYVALHCLEHFDTIKVALFTDEEVGCVGSRLADMSFFNDVSYAIQCDRQGYDDVVTNILWTEICSQEFMNDIRPLVKQWGKSFCDKGGLTDVYQLVENGMKVSAINVSCGYYRPHTEDEYIDLDDLYDTRDFVVDVIEALGDKPYHHTPMYTGYKAKQNGYNKYYGSRYYNGKYDDFYDLTDDSTVDDDVVKKKEVVEDTCPKCGGCDVMEDETINFLYCFTCDEYVSDPTLETYVEQ